MRLRPLAPPSGALEDRGHALAVVDIVKHLAAEVVAHGDNGKGPLLW